ncbi:Membrane attack complex component/perforin (MACPF) domain protein [Akanthomyces lecanii RCEF 1005]|uniref:Membrane attack complex component/perforin (MACPF) domain protein n=1 Tax=Akanthomyces lecanii RCEF 1005 TaxID=1081108 RepID=A0A162JP92_CORDF|nr:Membrane attack complex component/perforin (MACPF) domain protein [Akanthomyces lecanii RCEF 1005]
MSGTGLTPSQLEKIRGERKIALQTRDESSKIGDGDDAHVTSDTDDNSNLDQLPMPGLSAPQTHSSPFQLLGKFKVQSYIGNSELTALATFNNPWTSAEWLSKKLSELRQVLAPHVKAEYAFCMEDKSIVPEDMPVVDYFEDTASVNTSQKNTNAAGDEKGDGEGEGGEGAEGEHEEEVNKKGSQKAGNAGKSNLASAKRPAHNIIYLKQKAKAEPAKATAVDALSKAFMIKFVDKSGETSTSSIQSSELPGDKITMQLRTLRPHVQMSRDSAREEFCFSDGTSVSDSMLLKTYISKDDVPSDIDSDHPLLTVYFQKVGRKSIFAEASEKMKELGTIDTKTDLTFGEGNKNPVTTQDLTATAVDPSKLGFQKSFLESLASVTATKYLTAAELDELQWDTVLGNCNVMYGWKFDLDTMSVKRAPQPAFKLRKGLNLTPEPEVPQVIPSTQILASAAKSTAKPAETASTVKTGGGRKENASTAGAGEGGVKVEGEGGEGVEGEDEEEGEVEEEEAEISQAPVTTFVSRRKKPEALPNFCVVDDAKVEVTLVSSTLEESMAKNNFTASSFEVGGSANIKGVDIGASGGTSKRDETGSGARTSNIETLMVGHYRFPRASLLLRAEDLEPTEGLAAAIEKVRVSKSLEQLRALHNNYGHFFCEEVLIGGRLQTTRATRITDKYTMTRAKSQFKAQVGVALSLPKVASIDAKYSEESGSDQEDTKHQTTSSDSITFEATGGNTILATSPPRWTESVLDHRNWRVIERSGLTPLGEVLGRCSAVEVRQARAWFTQAVPFLSKWISIPESRVISVRLKFSCKIPQLNRQAGQVFDRDACHYFGHQYGKCVHPIRVGLDFRETIQEQIQTQMKSAPPELTTVEKLSMISPIGLMIQGSRLLASGEVTTDMTNIFKEVQTTEEIALFSPARVQAPVALQYSEVDLTAGITKDQYRETVWNMIVPYDEWLHHDSLVMLTSAAGKGYKDNVWLTVYRNAQGHFMPAMTSSGDASFWRVKKLNVSGQAHEISEGNTIKLTWRFSDQTAGFRDFYDDHFGRRTFSKPETVKEDELYLKLPFPGFQKTAGQGRASEESAGLAMIMSEIDSEAPILKEVAISSKILEGPQKRTYNLHDTSFRVDLVGNGGLGEVEDYMTVGLDQSLTQTYKDTIAQRTEILKRPKDPVDQAVNEVMNKVDQVGTALLGPAFPVMAAPAKTIISRATGLIKGFFGL